MSMSQTRARGREPRRFERFLLSFLGPPEVGDVNAPPSARTRPEDQLCTKCRMPYDNHERVHAPNMTYLTCPS
jgi:hypothetical protein